jgi:diguanylate cyclase
VKQWVRKLLAQLDMGGADENPPAGTPALELSDERATLLYLVDLHNKHLLEMEKWPVRKVREILDEFARQLVNPHNHNQEKLLFRLRQFLSTYRIDEFTYVQHTFDEFKGIVWDFADQLSEDVRFEQNKDVEVAKSLEQLREAVEANSIDELKHKSREFIDFYVSYQSQKDRRRTQRLDNIQRNLSQVKKRLAEANETAARDHMTQAFNRRSFDEFANAQLQQFLKNKTNCALLLFDIDHFKKVNDTYGHDAGDYVLKHLVKIMNEIFKPTNGFLARLGGEEFAILLPECDTKIAIQKAQEALERVRREVMTHGNHQIKITISLGVSQLLENETTEQWLKRTDIALYESKHNGRDRFSLAYDPNNFNHVA